MRINVLGWYGQKNVGDEAFRVVFEKFFRNSGVDLRFVTPGQGEDDVFTILGGGAVISPYYMEYLPKGAPCIVVGADFGYESEARLIVEHDVKQAYLRSHRDVEILRTMGYANAHAIPDLAFYLRPSGANVLAKYQRFPQLPAIGVFATDYVNPAIDRASAKVNDRALDFKIKLAKELDLLYELGFEPVLVPCSTGGYGDDRRINLDLQSFMRHTPTMIMDTLSPQETIDLIAQMHSTICMRFHAHIFSIIAGTPFVSIEFTRKVESLLLENKLTHLVGGRYPNRETFDFNLVRPLIHSFDEKSRDVLRGISAEHHVVLEGLRQELLQDLLAVRS